MRMTRSRTIGLLLALLTLSAVAGCQSYDIEAKRYELEEMLFEADKRLQSFSVKPELRTTADFAYLVEGYRGVFEKFRELFGEPTVGDSLPVAEQESAFLAGRAMMLAASIFIGGEELDSAAVILNQAIDAPYVWSRHKHEAHLLAGRVAQRLGSWLEAESHYTRLLHNYYPPVVNRIYPNVEVLELPKTIVTHYAAFGEREIAQAKADSAVAYYQSLLSLPSLTGTPAALATTRLLAEMYNARGEYQKSVDLLQSVVDSAGNVLTAARSLSADIYFARLDRKDDAVEIYRDIIRTPADSMFAPPAYLKLATILINSEQYAQARSQLEELKKRFERSRQVQIDAQQLIARSFEEEGEWDRALQEYQFMLSQFPDTPEALGVLSYIPGYLKNIGQDKLAASWRDKTVAELRKRAEENSGRQLGLLAQANLARFLILEESYAEAATELEQLFASYPKSAQAADALLKLGRINEQHLKDVDRALYFYREFVKLYPNSVVRPKVEEEINKLEQG
jgi:tetratricopeptide (TPR) repeat protein